MKRTLPTRALAKPLATSFALVLTLLSALSCVNAGPTTTTQRRYETRQSFVQPRTSTQSVTAQEVTSFPKPEVDTGGFLIYQPPAGPDNLLVGFAFCERYALEQVDRSGQRINATQVQYQYHVDLWLATELAVSDIKNIKASNNKDLFKVIKRPGSKLPDLPILYQSAPKKSDGSLLNRSEFRELVKEDYGVESTYWPDRRSTEHFELWKVTEALQPK